MKENGVWKNEKSNGGRKNLHSFKRVFSYGEKKKLWEKKKEGEKVWHRKEVWCVVLKKGLMIGCLVGNLTRNDSLSITNCFGNEMKWWKKRDDWKMRKRSKLALVEL